MAEQERKSTGIKIRKYRKPLSRIPTVTLLWVCVTVFLAGCGNLQENQISGQAGKGYADGENLAEGELAAEQSGVTLEELPGYLLETAADMPYACAEIVVTYPGEEAFLKGWMEYSTAFLSWKCMGADDGCREDVLKAEAAYREGKEQAGQEVQKAQEPILQENSVPESAQTNKNIEVRWLYLQFPVEENICGADLHDYLQEYYGNPENPILMITGGGGSSYRFSQSYNREVIVKEGMVYALLCQGIPLKQSVKPINELFLDFVQEVQEGGKISSGWLMDEEELYWTDHKERITTLEDPARTFTEVLGRDEDHWDYIMEQFGLLKEADYQVEISQGGPVVQIQFSFLEDIPETGYEAFRLNGFCADEDYEMKVTRTQDGTLLQTDTVQLCIEKTDTVDFLDLDEDGFLDMQISKPTHWNGEGAVMDEYAGMSYRLWNPETENFERKSLREIEARRRENIKKAEAETGNGSAGDAQGSGNEPGAGSGTTGGRPGSGNGTTGNYAGENIVVVEKGDCLWGIARRVYGNGSYYTVIYEKNAQMIGEDPSLIKVGMELVIPVPDSGAAAEE